MLVANRILGRNLHFSEAWWQFPLLSCCIVGLLIWSTSSSICMRFRISTCKIYSVQAATLCHCGRLKDLFLKLFNDAISSANVVQRPVGRKMNMNSEYACIIWGISLTTLRKVTTEVLRLRQDGVFRTEGGLIMFSGGWAYYLFHSRVLLVISFDLKDRSDMSLRNFGLFSMDHTSLYNKTWDCS